MTRPLLGLACLATLLLHVGAALLWMLGSPRGFPLSHPGFWSGLGIPGIVVISSLVALFGSHALRERILLAFPVMYLGGAAAVAVLFPVSSAVPAAFATIAGVSIAGLVASALRPSRSEFLRAAPALVLAALLGVGMAFAQRGPAASTHPDPASSTDSTDRATYRYESSGLRITLRPALEFISTSPDRFWTLFSAGPQPQASCSVAETRTPTVLTLDARCRLAEDVYSHLNTYAAFDVVGHQALSVSFSPVPDLRIPIEPSDYPVGRPSTLAFLGADRVFRIVRAASAEKGPFEELGSGPLPAGEPLVLTLLDQNRAAVELRLEAFARHASTALSPTAGWGLPQNAIEFRRSGEDLTAPVNFWITLAGTSTGRGFNSVGHKAGEYRNRLRLRPGATSPPGASPAL